ncbi:MAG: hypothetical protein J5871_01730, partial [Bacteroidales bacterium]|nr:hypothetical protein [Bacteroidales bacterium]
ITVSNGVENKDFVYDATTGKFAGDRFVDATGSGFVMIYPSAVFTSASYSGGTFTVNVNLPAAQTFKDHASCSKLPMMANCPPISAGGQNSVTVRFKSICGVLGFPVTGDLDKGNFASVSFTGAGACGAGTLTCAKGVGNSLAPNLTMTDASTSRTITLSDTGTTSESTAVRYYMYLPPKTYANPKVTVNFASGSVSEVSRTKESLTVMCNYITCAELYFQTLFSGGGELGSATGTAAHPYLIKTENDLRELAAKVNGTAASYIAPAAAGTTYSTSGKYYKLVNDITLTSGFTPIGTDANPFQGVFVGNSKTISGLSVTGASACRGLFGVLSGATVSNLTISGPSVTGGTNFIGALAGKALSTAISSVTVSGGTVSGTGNTIGGLVGLLNGGSITSCSTTCAVSGASYVGGVIGSAAAGNISSCTRSSGTVAASAQHVGGIIGSLCGLDGDGNTSYSASTASISGCNSSCAVSCSRSDNGNAYVGGVIGSTVGGAVTNCNTTGGSVTANQAYIVGGVIGELNGGATMQGTSDGSRGSNAATVSGYYHVGGVCGKVWNGTLRYYNNNASVSGVEAAIGGISGGTGSGGTSTVTYCTNNGAVSRSGSSDREIFLGGVVGDSPGPANIDHCANNVDLGSSANPIKGRLVGGIVGCVTGSTQITNCNYTNHSIYTNGHYLGGIVGAVNASGGGCGIRDCTVSGCTISTSSGTTGCLGGITGKWYSPTTTWADYTNVIYHCKTSGCLLQTTSGSLSWSSGRVGGIVGTLENNSRVIECCAKQNRCFSHYACGGIAGYIDINATAAGNGCLIRQCMSQNNWLQANSTDAYNMLGGIVGCIEQDGSPGSVNITECISDMNYHESAYSGGTNWRCSCGGIIGRVCGSTANVAIRNCFSHYADSQKTTGSNPRGTGYSLFHAKNKNSGTGMGGIVGYFSSDSGGTLRILNTGSCCDYSATFAVSGQTTTKANCQSNWGTWGINPIIGRVDAGKVEMNLVAWTWATAPFTCSSWHGSSSMQDMVPVNTTIAFNYDGTGSYYWTTTINSSYIVTGTKTFPAGTNGSNHNYSSYWSPLGHAPTQVKTNLSGERWQVVSMLNQWQGYARDHDYVNENMGYTGHNWSRSNSELAAGVEKNRPEGVYNN